MDPDGCRCDPDAALIDAVLEAVLNHPGGRTLAAWGPASPPSQATVTGSPRLVLGVDGRNRMRLPAGHQQVVDELVRGDCVCIHRHAWNQPLHDHPKTFLTIDCKPDRIRFYLRTAPRVGKRHDTARCLWILRPPGPTITHLVAATESLLGTDRGDQLAAVCRCLIAEYRHELRRGATVAGAVATWLRIRDWIDEHVHEAIDRGAVARACGIHPNHCSRVVRQHAGMGFVAYLTDQRLMRACSLLERGDLAVGSVARRCGFANPEYFATVFRRHRGCAPRQWRWRG